MGQIWALGYSLPLPNSSKLQSVNMRWIPLLLSVPVTEKYAEA